MIERYGEELEEFLEQYEDVTILDLGHGGTTAVRDIAGGDNRVIQMDTREFDEPYVRGDAEELPLADDSVDVVFAAAMFYGHWSGLCNVYAEESDVWRVLREGGELIQVTGYFKTQFDTAEEAYYDGFLLPWEERFEQISLDGKILRMQGYKNLGQPRMAVGDLTEQQLRSLTSNSETVELTTLFKELEQVDPGEDVLERIDEINEELDEQHMDKFRDDPRNLELYRVPGIVAMEGDDARYMADIILQTEEGLWVRYGLKGRLDVDDIEAYINSLVS